MSKSAGFDGERRQLILVFVDVVGSTELSTQMDSEDFADLMLEFQKLAGTVFEQLGGRVANYLGDGLLVCFGYPQAQENDAERAVRAAFELFGRLKAMRAGETSAQLQARVGIHAGTVVVGSSNEGLGSILLGEAVNVAARIQAAAEPASVFASTEALQLMRGKFASRANPPVALKGIRNKVVLHHIRRPAINKRAAAHEALKLIGRASSVAQLTDALGCARKNERCGVSITGDPGLGKSTLIEGFRAAVAEDPPIWLEARCDVLQTGGALHPFIDLARKSLGILDHHSVDASVQKLIDGLEVWSDKPSHALPIIARLLGLPLSDKSLIAKESPESLRTLTLETLVAWIEFLATRRPVVLICEDLHWSDATTLDCLDLLLRREDPARLLCLLTSRPGHRGLTNSLLKYQIELAPLAQKEARALVRAVDVDGRLNDTMIDRVVARAAGVPLFLEELTRQAVREDDPNDARVPQSLDGLVMQQLDSLPGEAKATAQLASALGQTFDYEVLAAVSNLETLQLDIALEALLEADVVREVTKTPASYNFRHALTRDGAYGTMLRRRRIRIHADAAHCLMTQFAEMSDKRPAVIAHHLLQSGQLMPAAQWFQKAGWTAAQQAAVEDAATLYQRALSALKTAPEGADKDRIELSLQILLGNALMGVRGFGSDEIVPVWERALNLAEGLKDHDERSSALNGLAAYWIGKGDCARACDYAQRILTWSDPAKHRIGELRAHSSLANAKFQIGHVSDALDHAERAISLYHPDDFSNVTYGVGTDQGVVAYGAAAASHWWLGATETGLERARAGVALAEGLESSLSVAAARSYLALILHYRGEDEEAHSVADETVSFCTHLGIPFWQGLCQILRAGQDVDPPATRLKDVEAGLAILSKTGSQSAVGLGFTIMASAHNANGSPDIALAILNTGAQMSAMLGQHFWDAEVKRLTGKVQLATGAKDEAVKTLHDALSTANRQEARSLSLRTALTLAEVQGSHDTVRAEVADALSHIETESTTPDAIKARELISNAFT